MTETTHTPGPWRVTNEDWQPWSGAIGVQGPDQPDDGMLFWSTRGGNEIANANLIAAAPDMLDALKRAESCFDAMAEEGYLNGHRREVWAEMRAAIAKAEGRS